MDVPNILVAFGNFIEGLKILGNKNRINPSHFDCVGKVELILKAQQKICIDHVKYCKVSKSIVSIAYVIKYANFANFQLYRVYFGIVIWKNW